jgi:hypothetical protein
MKFVKHIQEILFVENGGQRNFQEEKEKKLKNSQKISCMWTPASELRKKMKKKQRICK